MGPNELTALIAAIAGIIVSIVAEFFPSYQALEDKWKRVTMAVAIIVAAGASMGLACSGWFALLVPGIALTCDQAGVVMLIQAIVATLVSNQATFSLLFRGKPQPFTTPEVIERS